MKKIGLLVLCSLWTMGCVARSPETGTEERSADPLAITSKPKTAASEPAVQNTKHLNFKGVPIDSTLSEYVSKMEEAGFTHLSTEEGAALLRGDFAGFKGCTVGVATIKSVNKVNMIGVMFPEQKDWRSLESMYKQLKTMLTEKYGEPSDCVEEFQYRSYERNPLSDDDKWFKLLTNECTWYTTYSTAEGDIQLSLSRGDFKKPFVVLRYWDRINTDAVQAQAMEDL